MTTADRRAITPRAEERHVAFSSIRVEPAWMVIGHSTGIAAALSAAKKQDVQQLDYATLKTRLEAQRQVVDLVPTP